MFSNMVKPKKIVKYDNRKSLVTLKIGYHYHSFFSDMPIWYVENDDVKLVSIQHYF